MSIQMCFVSSLSFVDRRLLFCKVGQYALPYGSCLVRGLECEINQAQHFHFIVGALLHCVWTCEKRNMWTYERQHVNMWETTCEHVRNNMWTCEKQHVNMWETTCEHVRNNMWTCEKQHVNMWETTCEHVRNNMWKIIKINNKKTYLTN